MTNARSPIELEPNSVQKANFDDDLQLKLRELAFQRLDREVFNRLFSSEAALHFAADDLRVLASVLREARRQIGSLVDSIKWIGEADALVEKISGILKNSELPTKPSNAPPFREFFLAAIEWYEALYTARHLQQFERMIAELSRLDMSAMPDLRERLAVGLADIGRRSLLSDELERFVHRLADKPYLLTSAGVLRLLGLSFHRGLREVPVFSVADEWLHAWFYHLGRASFRADRENMLSLRNDIHTRLSLLISVRKIVSGCFGIRNCLLLLVIKLDHRVFIATRMNSKRLGRFWFAFVRFAARRLGRLRRDNVAGQAPSSLPLVSNGLIILDVPKIFGTRYDTLVSRAQGGFGDILTMRPGLIAAARLSRRGRVVFATSRDFFPVFSIDDPVDLVDIERSTIVVRSFGRWFNLTECPAARVEAKEFPKVRSNRINIFARAMGARLSRFNRHRIYPITFEDAIELTAKKFVAEHAPTGIRIGIQLRSAESYKDVPAMMDVARTLAKTYSVFVFDSRPIPRQAHDRLIAVENQPLRLALATLSQMDALLTPDSSFMHIAGTNNIPCLALFGSADGRVRCKPYPSVRYLDMRRDLACVPCWRNEVEKCRLGNGYVSICLNYLTVPIVVAAMENIVASVRRRRTGSRT